MVAKRALLVGCNYPGTEATLRGCINDVTSINTMLTTHYGFTAQNIKIMIDSDSDPSKSPTGANIKKALSELVKASAPGDVLVFHFSGHGTQIPDKDGGEADNLDEAICPTDMNLICDDDLRTILAPLPPTVKFTMISDCCHSGSMLDHPVQQIAGDKDPNAPKGLVETPAADLMGMFFKGAPGANEAKNRALPTTLFAKMLASKAGGSADPTKIRGMLSDKFGDDATNKVMGAASMLKQQADKMAAGGGAHAKHAGMVSKLLGMCLSGGSSSTGGASAGGVAGVPGQSGAGGQATAGGTETKGAAGTGVLITGCQSNETSADACPSGDPAKAFGALTNALTTTVNAVKAKDPNANPTNKQLVTHVRKTLEKAKFTQNPCLECEVPQVGEPFIC